MKIFCTCILFAIISIRSFAQLPVFEATVYDSSLTGYYFLSSHYADRTAFTILDHNGDILYYKPLFKRPITYNFSLLSNGLISYAAETCYYFMDSTFKVVDSVSCKNIYKTDPHDFKLMSNGHYLLLGADTVRMDLSKAHVKRGFDKDTALVRTAVIQELDENKRVVFEWHAKDHFDFNDVDTFNMTKVFGTIDIEHANSVEPDEDGNILLSSRNFSEITKINHRDESIMWRLGGKHNEFRFVNCPVPFYGQHDVRRIENPPKDGSRFNRNEHITLFDGGHSMKPHGARALEFELDEKNKIATLTRSYIYNDTMDSQVHGNVQRLANSNALVNFGKVNNDILFVVVDAAGRKMFQLSSPDRVDSYRSFYYPSLPWQVHRPQISCFDSLGVMYLKTMKSYASYQWSDSGSSRAIAVIRPGTYYVFVPYGEGGYICSEKMNITDMHNSCNSSLPSTGKGQKKKQ